MVFFAFPKETRKIRCSISMLTEISPVFATMLSDRWNQEKTDNVDDNKPDSQPDSNRTSRDRIVRLDDYVSFDQYSTFLLLMEVLYGLRQLNTLTVDQAAHIFYYAHKYEMTATENEIQKFLNRRMQYGIKNVPLNLAEVKEGIDFARVYGLDKFRNSLDKVKLALSTENVFQFWHLTTESEMKNLQEQIVDYAMKGCTPNKDWPLDLLVIVAERMQTLLRTVVTEAATLTECPRCQQLKQFYCRDCRIYDPARVSSVFRHLDVHIDY